MDTEYLRTFCVVARHQNFRKAAEILRVTQPCISRRIRSLEEELGVALFERTTHAVTLTNEGRSFLPFAEQSVHLVQEGARRVSEGREAEVALAATPTTSFNWLPEVLMDFRRRCPLVLHLYTAPSTAVLEMVLDQRIDLGVVTVGFTHPLLEQRVLWSEGVVLVGSPSLVDSYLGPDGRLAPEAQAAGIPLILSRQMWDAVGDEAAPEHGFVVVAQAEYVQVAEALARRGLGLALLPYSVAWPGLREGALREVPWPGAPLPERPIYLLYPKASAKAKVVAAFMESARHVTQTWPRPAAVGAVG
ncbi:MAG: LysR family transcriptional regulator [Firmicutes bacterium]|nr:LysR family transcriptional regulator [Bacillota bacterium]